MHFKCLLFGLCVLLAMTTAADPLEDFFEEQWENFKTNFQRKYASPFEHAERFRIFVENVRLVLAHNELFKRGESTFDVVINLFGDMTVSEVVKQRNGFNRTQQLARERGFPFGIGHHLFDLPRFRIARAAAANGTKSCIVRKHLPEEIDWVKLGAVTPVLDQGHCGSCWAFSAVGALEGQHFKKTGMLVALSVQQLIDCARENGNNGCNGGVMEEAFEYVKDNGGLAAASDYEFEEEQHDCAAAEKGKHSVAMDSGFKRIPSRNECKLMEAVAKVGPVAVAIDASQPSFQFYKGGVYYEPKCASGRMDHGVLVVGYGTDADSGAEYWLVKNTWGTGWGEDGYIRMARNRMNNCCIACYGAYPID